MNIYYIENIVNHTTTNGNGSIQLFQTDSSKVDFHNQSHNDHCNKFNTQNTINGNNNNTNINTNSPKGNYITETFEKLTFSQRVKVFTLIAKLLKENEAE